MGRAKPPEGGGPKPDTRHGIYIPPQCQAEEARHGTAPHDASGRRKRVDQRAADQPSEGAPAASRGVVHSAGGFVPSNNFVIPTPQILALALASHGPGGGEEEASPRSGGCGPDPSAPQRAASPRPSGQTPVGPVGEHHPLQRRSRGPRPALPPTAPACRGCAHVCAVQTRPPDCAGCSAIAIVAGRLCQMGFRDRLPLEPGNVKVFHPRGLMPAARAKKVGDRSAPGSDVLRVPAPERVSAE